MPFLPSLRMANIFPRKPATDRPFGMPDIDSGNIAEILRAVGPTAETMNRDRFQQDSQLARLATQMRPGSRRPMNQGIQGPGGPGSPFNPNINTQLGPDLGPTAPQRMFLGEDANQRMMEQRNTENNTRFMRGIDEAKAKEAHDLAMADKEIQGQTSLFNRKLAGEKELAGNKFGYEKELEGQKQRSAADIARANTAARSADVTTRERVRGEEARKTQSEKPVTMLPSQQDNDFNNRVQKMIIDNPNVAPFIEKDERGMIRIKDTASPEQAAWISSHLSSTGNMQAATPGKVIRQKNKAGQIRESTDGGKTWKMVQ